jgi:hypothetical protein
MQDVQNIPNPDVNSPERDDGFGSHSEVDQNDDIEQTGDAIPVPPDTQPAAPIEEPPETDRPRIDEDQDEPKRIA